MSVEPSPNPSRLLALLQLGARWQRLAKQTSWNDADEERAETYATCAAELIDVLESTSGGGTT